MTGPPTELARRLRLSDAVTIGLGAMLGAGVFAAFGPAAAAAGPALLFGLVLAAAVAYCNATSSAQLAAVYPQSGGSYVYGRRRLGPVWGYLAGWSFVVGKIASCSAMALTFGAYVTPDAARPTAVAAVVAVTAINYFGVRKTVVATRVIVTVVLVTLVVVVAAVVTGGSTEPLQLQSVAPGGVLQAAGLLFFAFAGYARVATLGEEVVDPAVTIPRAIPLALGITVGVYAVVAVAALLSVGADVLANSTAPLLSVVEAGRLRAAAPLVRVGAAVASFGVLLSLTVGVSRTAMAMARNGEMPGALARVHPRHQVPHVAEIAVALLVVTVVLVADLRGAIGFSSFGVLTYYGIANASAWTQPASQRRWPRGLQIAGMIGCAVLAFSLPVQSVLTGAVVLLVGLAVWIVRRRLVSAS